MISLELTSQTVNIPSRVWVPLDIIVDVGPSLLRVNTRSVTLCLVICIVRQISTLHLTRRVPEVHGDRVIDKVGGPATFLED